MATQADPRPQTSKLTYEDYVTLPDDGRRYEILDGELAVSPSPRTLHQLVSVRLTLAIGNWVTASNLGTLLVAPCDVILDDSTIVVPDLVFIARGRADAITERAVEQAPDLLIEILSDSTARRDRGAKKQLYARYGVGRYWLVDAERRSLEIYALRDGAYALLATYRGDDIVSCDVPAGLELRLGDIWPA